MHDLSFLSFDSSIKIEYGLARFLTSLFRKYGARASFMIAVHFVRAQENFFAVSESLKILLNSFVAWSLFKKARLCLATNRAHRASASITRSVEADWTKEDIDLDEEAALDISMWRLTPTCFLMSFLSP